MSDSAFPVYVVNGINALLYSSPVVLRVMTNVSLSSTDKVQPNYSRGTSESLHAFEEATLCPHPN